MRIAGLQKLSLLDFPGRMAATVFCPGCDFRCPFCHNAPLVLPGKEGFPAMDLGEVRSFLEKRRGVLDGVCVTGGEPLLQPDIADFCAELKAMGYAVKLDTNGTFPATLAHLVERGLVDYVAMDVKAAICNPAAHGRARRDESSACEGAQCDGPSTPALAPKPASASAPVSGMSLAAEPQEAAAEEAVRFAQVAGIDRAHAPALMQAVGESASFLMKGLVPYEFRTTVVRELHDETHVRAIAASIRGASAWYLQGFVDSDGVIGGRGRFHAYSPEEMYALAEAVRPLVPSVRVRGVD